MTYKTNTGPVFPYIASSAASVVNYGVMPVMSYSENTTLASQATYQWVNDFFPGTLELLEINSDNVLVQNYSNALIALMESINFIPVQGQSAGIFRSLINESYLTFTIKYNSSVGWILNLGDSTGELIEGIVMVPGVNFLQGLRLDIDIKNLFVVNIQDGDSSLVTAWGAGVRGTPVPTSLFFYFDDTALTNFIEAANKLAGPAELQFDITKMDYGLL